jgi:hypothetical protein
MRSIVLWLALIPAVAHADSLTVEADVGVGEQLGVAAPAVGLGIGGWIAPHVALTARAAAITLAPQSDQAPFGQVLIQNYRRTFAFTGPSVQYWFDDHLWVGAGLGLATYNVIGIDSHGVAADLRAGYAFGAFAVSLEVIPSYLPENGGLDPATGMTTALTTTGFAMLAGYQFR